MRKNIDSRISVDLSGKVCVVIGGTGSIGSEISAALFKSGAKVIIAGRQKKAQPDGILERERFLFIPVDIANEASVRGLSERVLKRYGGIDILVLVHGVQFRKPFYDIPLDEWKKVIDINLTGTFIACKYLTEPMMQKKCGKIIGITSLTSGFGIKNVSAYAASKGGMSGFLRTIAIELAKYNINVNMIAPGRIKTKMTQDLIKNRAVMASNLKCIPMGRFGLPSDLTGATLFLASASSDYMTGQTIYIDGGWTAGIGNPQD